MLLGGLTACATADKDVSRLSPEPAGAERRPLSAATEHDAVSDFARAVVSDLDAMWTLDFKRRGKTYVPAGPTLFSENTACSGKGNTACTAWATIDLDFQRSLHERFGTDAKAPQAYAVAHQIGHHVQRVMGIDTKVRELLAARPIAAYAVETQLELQADCFAGVWLRSTPHRELLPPIDVERALRQASELGKEVRVAQKEAKRGGESFTYAIPRRRDYWFYQGFENGRIEDCNTFATDD